MIQRLLAAEWLRFKANPANHWILGIFCLALLLNAAWAGWNAREFRLQQQREMAEWQQQLEGERTKLSAADPALLTAEKNARTAFDFARHKAPPAQLPAREGLALSASAFKLFDTATRVTITNRHVDNRKSETLSNPQLDEIGDIDFATLTALLLPILCICLGYGLLQDDRESGVWRLTAMTHPRTWQVLAAALVIRWGAIVACLALSSALAFAVDNGSSLPAYLNWVSAGAGFAAIWIGLAGLYCLLPISAGASASAQLATWILSGFVVPAALAAHDGPPPPSRMTSIATMRAIQLDVDEQGQTLLTQWYAQNGHTPVPIRAHVWPVSFMPRYEAESLRTRPLFRQFDEVRVARDARLASWMWLSPGISLLNVADRLAGIDSARYLGYALAVDAYEDRWRAYFTPRIMFHGGLTHADLARLPTFEFADARTPATRPALRLWLVALVLLLVFLLFRHRANTP